MITETIRQFIESLPYLFVATADLCGQPHMAIGKQVAISGDSLLIFENWFCPSTLQNITENSQVAVVVASPDSGSGYQLLGSVVRYTDAATINGFDPTTPTAVTPQVLTRFTVRVEKILEFTNGIHSDIPIAD